MTALNVFGLIVTGSQVEKHATDWLKAWLPTYLAEMERQTGRATGVLQTPRSWSTTNRFSQRQGDQLPEAIVVSPGTARLRRAGDGGYDAWWGLSVGVVVEAKDRESVNDLAKVYGAAIRALIVQQPSLDGFAGGTELLAEAYDTVPADYLEVGAVVEVRFNVLVNDIVTAAAGPAAPSLAPGDWPTVADVDLTLQRRSLT